MRSLHHTVEALGPRLREHFQKEGPRAQEPWGGWGEQEGVAQPVQHGRVEGSRHLQLTSNTDASPALSHGPLGHCILLAPIPTPGPEVPRPQA